MIRTFRRSNFYLSLLWLDDPGGVWARGAGCCGQAKVWSLRLSYFVELAAPCQRGQTGAAKYVVPPSTAALPLAPPQQPLASKAVATSAATVHPVANTAVSSALGAKKSGAGPHRDHSAALPVMFCPSDGLPAGPWASA